jgi:dephospho-CoA kinase
MPKRLIVCLTGMPGAGKSTVAFFLKEKGFAVVRMGDAVREEAKRLGFEPTDTNLGKLMLKLRQDLGPGAVGHIVMQKLEREASSGNIVIDGIRSIPEVEILKNIGQVKLLAVHASQRTRFKHLKKRGRSDAPANSNDFEERDKRELSIGISEAIAFADETISNNDLTLEQLNQRACGIVKVWLKEIERNT